MGVFNPLPPLPPTREVHHTAPPISVAEESTFDAWMALPEEDGRTLEEYAANPVVRPVTLERDLPRFPPTTPPLRRENRTATRNELPPDMETVQPGRPIILPQDLLYAPLDEINARRRAVDLPPLHTGVLRRSGS